MTANSCRTLQSGLGGLIAVLVTSLAYAECPSIDDDPPASYLPRTGSPSIAVLLAHTNDISPPVSREAVERKLFGANGSMREYFYENSSGQLALEGEVGEWFPLAKDYEYYEGACVDDIGGPAKKSHCVRLILEEAVNADAFEWEKFDSNGDSFVDTVVVVLPSDQECSRGADSNLGTKEHKYFNLTSNPRFLKTDRPGANGKEVCINEFVVVPATNCDGSEATSVGDIAHEIGHALGLPDLEDLDWSAGGIGVWGLMGWGGSGADRKTPDLPTHLSAWAKDWLGWVKPEILVPGSYTLPPVETYLKIYKLESGRNDGIHYLLENRQRVGFDADLPGRGLLIWRIDEVVIANWNETLGSDDFLVNDDDRRRGVDLIEADGAYDIRLMINYGDSGDPFPGTTDATVFDLERETKPRSFALKALCGIHRDGDHIAFEVSDGKTCDP